MAKTPTLAVVATAKAMATRATAATLVSIDFPSICLDTGCLLSCGDSIALFAFTHQVEMYAHAVPIV